MLLSIDKTLQMLAEGKSVEKIAELADVQVDDVISLISEARDIINKKDQTRARKKIKIKKKIQPSEQDRQLTDTDDLFKGADLTVIPLETTLQFYIKAMQIKHAVAVGIIIHDGQNRQVGAIRLNESGEKIEPVIARMMEKCEKIGDYFKAKRIRLKIDDEMTYNLFFKKVDRIDKMCNPHFDHIRKSQEKYSELLVELIDAYNNQKAEFLIQREQ